MFWWFERHGRFLRCEARQGADHDLELRILPPDGVERVESFVDSADLTKRQAELAQQLATEGWTGPHGWNV